MRNEDFGNFGNPADILKAILITEAEVGVQAGSEVVTVEDRGEATLLVKDAFCGICDGGFSGTGQAAHPDDDAALAKKVFFVLTMQEAMKLGMDIHRGKASVRTLGKKAKPDVVRGDSR